jgi:hypothetical protein
MLKALNKLPKTSVRMLVNAKVQELNLTQFLAELRTLFASTEVVDNLTIAMRPRGYDLNKFAQSFREDIRTIVKSTYIGNPDSDYI